MLNEGLGNLERLRPGDRLSRSRAPRNATNEREQDDQRPRPFARKIVIEDCDEVMTAE